MSETRTPLLLEEGFYTVQQVEELAGLSPSGFRYLRARGEGPPGGVYYGRKAIWPKEAVHEWIKGRIRPTYHASRDSQGDDE
jgi:hypothetical protein